jgi:uncharacterized spore protein YtfJ
MKIISRFVSLAACLALWVGAGNAQPMAKPLASFDKMVSDLRSSSVVGEPILAGDTTVIPFAAVQFGMGSARAMGGVAGGMGSKTVPLGVVIVEGDDVRVEMLPEQPQKPSVLQQLVQGIIDRKVTIMGNGINVGHAPGDVKDLTDMVTGMKGQTTVVGNALNIGQMHGSQPAGADKTISDLEATVGKSPTAANYYKLGEAYRKSGQKEKAIAAYQKAIKLRPGYADAARALAGTKK